MDLHPVYVLLGSENLLKETAVTKIKEQCFPEQDQTLLSFNFISLDAKTTPISSVLDQCQQLPFMGNIRLVILKDADKIITEELIEYIKNPIKTACLVLLVSKLDKRLTTYKTLAKYASIKEFDHPQENEIKELIQHYIKSQRKTISPQDASYIASSLENDLTGIMKELEKLVTYVGDRNNITDKDIENIISHNKLNNSFSLTDAIQKKDTEGAIKLVNNLVDQGKSIPEIVGILRWMITRIWQGKELLESENKNIISKQLRIPPYFLGRFIDQINKFKIVDLKKGLIRLLATEKVMRNYSIPSYLILELLVIGLTENTSESV